MARPLSEKKRLEWKEQFRLAEDFYKERVLPSRKFEAAYRNNDVLWEDLRAPSLLNERQSWPYDAITVNLVFANAETVLPQSLLKHPKVFVSPSIKVTNRAARIGSDPLQRRLAAFVVQEYQNWRIREFDFKRQAQLAQADDFLRGRGFIRHGYAADTDVTRFVRDKEVELNHHQHVREGWPYAIYWPVDEVRFDATARVPEERQWVAFADFWRLEDLRSRWNVPAGMQPSHILSIDERMQELDPSRGFRDEAQAVLGRELVWEVWDRRTKEVIWWSKSLGREIGHEPWPLEWEHLPYTELSSTLEGTPEIDKVWELNQEINKLVSMLLVYAKRGVPLIGVNEGMMNEDDVEKLADAEILEVLRTKGVPSTIIQRLSLEPIPQQILIAINQLMELHREVGGQSRFSRGARENVESAQEAFQIAQGANVRIDKRQLAVKEFLERMIRKDFQTARQTVFKTQRVMDVLSPEVGDLLLLIPPELLQFDFDFSISVGSMRPESDQENQQQALIFLQAMQAMPGLVNHFSPRRVAQWLAATFGVDEAEFLAPEEAALQSNFVDRLQELALNQKGSRTNGGLGAAIDAGKPTRDNARRAGEPQ